ncbi:flightin isoform X2 [Harmonia axyridis]|uniref:flightin isoform X2 n=1 Tax=Harmonia axyridis TaxID=115357 RepID=UPI001E276527|nr:flightin isoform X2 [Harmonia axyridis]
MADDDWFASMDDEPEPEPEPAAKAPKAGGAKAAGDAAQAQAEAAEGGEEEKAPEEEAPAEDEYLDPDKLILFKHWIRPKFQQYKYLYDYQYSYYDNVLDYLEKRSKGYRADPPRPQTWAERAMRTYSKRENQNLKFRRSLEDIKMVTRSEISGVFQSYHARQYLNRRLTARC